MTKDPIKGKDEWQAREDTHNQSNKEIISRIYKEFLQINKLKKKKKKDHHPREKGLKGLESISENRGNPRGP